MTTPTPTELGALKTAAWKAIRKSGQSGSSADFDAANAAMRAVEDAAEDYRLAHHPNALRLFVLADDEIGQPLSIYAVCATGPECVYEAEVSR